MPSGKETRGATHATAADLPEGGGFEVVDGQLVSKAFPGLEHRSALALICGGLIEFFGAVRAARPGGWWIAVEMDVEIAPDQVYLPDIAGWRIDRVPESPSGRPVAVPPDWVCEVLSPSTAACDLGVKQRNYHAAGTRSGSATSGWSIRSRAC